MKGEIFERFRERRDARRAVVDEIMRDVESAAARFAAELEEIRREIEAFLGKLRES